jgi:hypothetical protein
MHRIGSSLVFSACLAGFASNVAADPPILVSCDEVPAGVVAIAAGGTIEAYGIDPAAAVVIAAIVSPGDAQRSVLRFAKGGDSPRDVKLAGHVSGLALAPDGTSAYVIVRATDKKGGVRSVDLVRLDFATARVAQGATLPATASGLAVGRGGATLLVAAKNEIRTFQLPELASGPLYRALGDNVGVAPMADSSVVYVAQPSRIVLADLTAPQDRDGLALSQEAPAPAPLKGMLTATGDLGPIVFSDGGRAWCVRAGALPPPPVAPAPAAAPPEEAPPAAVVPAVPPPAQVPEPEQVQQQQPPAHPSSGEAGTVSGVVSGPSVADVAAIVLLGPDNVLHEAARAIPDDEGRFSASSLPPGVYRLVAAGKGGRVLICDPPFITIRVGSNGAVEAPVLKVLRAQ